MKVKNKYIDMDRTILEKSSILQLFNEIQKRMESGEVVACHSRGENDDLVMFCLKGKEDDNAFFLHMNREGQFATMIANFQDHMNRIHKEEYGE